MSVINFNKVSKIFDLETKKTFAVNNLSFNINEHSIVGLLGKNGAGKSTILKLIAKHITPTNGEICIKDFDINSNTDICLVRDYEPLFTSFNIRQIISFTSDLYRNFNHKYADKLIELFGIDQKKKYQSLSKGQKGKFNLIIALASRAYITLFDETYISLDAPSRKQFFDLLLEDYNDFPRTIIISTHYLDEVSNIFDKVILVNDGSLVLEEDTDAIQAKAYTIFGNLQLGCELLKDKNIISKEVIANKCSFSLYDQIDDYLIRELKENNFSVSITPLAMWFVDMVNKEDKTC